MENASFVDRHFKFIVAGLSTLLLFAVIFFAFIGRGVPNAPRLSSTKQCVAELERRLKQELRQIPATVIDKGVLRNIPYTSYAAGDHEFNVYGDPDSPSCVEIGIYNDLLQNPDAKRNCLLFVLSLLGNESDRLALKKLDLSPGSKIVEGLTFEITPETSEDAFGGWWISIYDEKMLEAARAKDQEMKEISESLPKDTAAQPSSPTTSTLSWSLADFNWSRRSSSKSKSGGAVYVSGYYRKNGTYVRSHTRRR